MSAFIGRTEPLARLTAAFQVAALSPTDGPTRARAGPRWPRLVLVLGEAGIGKTALLDRFATDVAAHGARVAWGTCWDGEQAPAWWPWTQALRTLAPPGEAPADLAAIVPEWMAGAASVGAAGPADRVQVFDAVGRLLAGLVVTSPTVVILDDLQWADRSTVDLLRFLAHQPQPGALMLVGAYRPHEPSPGIAAGLAELATAAELVLLQGLSAAELDDLVRAIAGPTAPDEWARLVHTRTGGHPFFARELCRLLATGAAATATPAAVREVIAGRLARLSAACRALLDAAAVAGNVLLTDVLADVTGTPPIQVLDDIAEATAASILAAANPTRFTHDLYRETIVAALPSAQRIDLHHRIAGALLARDDRGATVLPVELARHFAAAIPLAGVTPAVTWARRAARADTTRFAFADAARHLTRVRAAAAETGHRLSDDDLVGLLTEEADLRQRAGHLAGARSLLDTAWARAQASGDGALLGPVALGLDQLGARFAMPRADLISVLEIARQALDGSASALEAQVTAALARQCQHSVPADRPQARPLAERAVAIARTLGAPATLAGCLLAHHDALWTPGTATERAAIATEITDLARRADDPERRAQGLLLTASAQLEDGLAAFRATLNAYQHTSASLRQPRHDYLSRIRQAALALIDGDIHNGERLSAEAAELGRSIGDTDTDNVRMSQRLEIARARNDPDELRATASDAVHWWVGAPAHAHAVAAGFFARAGDHDGARRELDTVLSLDWRADRSYLWSIFTGELTTAAIALCDRPLARQLLDDLMPLAGACAVNGALVCFMGAHAHRIGLLWAALSQPETARQWLTQALRIHRRLGAVAWEAESGAALADLDGAHMRRPPDVPPARPRTAGAPVELRRIGDMWQATYEGQSVYLRDMKGMHDLATLLARPGVDLSAVDLAGVRLPAERTDAALDRTALAAYRQRLADLGRELAAASVAEDRADPAHRQRLSEERERLHEELRKATRPGGRPRPLGSTTVERARKAVTARIRAAIARIAGAHPNLGTHLDRTVRTGTTCRYDPVSSGTARTLRY